MTAIVATSYVPSNLSTDSWYSSDTYHLEMLSNDENRRAPSRSGRETPVTQIGPEVNEAVIRNGDDRPGKQSREPISTAQASSSSATNAKTERSETKRKEYTRQTVDTSSKASLDQT